MEGAVIASMPQRPSYYNPLGNDQSYKVLMGYINIDGVPITGENYAAMAGVAKARFSSILQNASVPTNKNSNDIGKWLEKVLKTTITFDGKEYAIQYERGRKDSVLARMLEDEYINEQQFVN